MTDAESSAQYPLHPAIAAVIKVSLEGQPSLIGSGFFVNSNGLFVTAKHVISDNIDSNGRDRGGIGALLLDPVNFGQYLPFAWSSMHPHSDISLSDTHPRKGNDGNPITTPFLRLSIIEPCECSEVSSRFFCHADTTISDKDLILKPTPRIIGTAVLQHGFVASEDGTPATSVGLVESAYGSQARRGELRKHWRPLRDTVMLPFPVFESDLAIPGSGSGGPVFNAFGEVIGINTTGIPGSDISYHTYISELLELQVRVLLPDYPNHCYARVKDLASTGRLPINGVFADTSLPLWVDPPHPV